MVTSKQYVYGTSPRKLEVEKTRKVSKKTKKKVKSKAKSKALLKMKTICVTVLVFATMFGICYRYSLINQRFKEVQGIKKEYIALETANAQTEIGIQSDLDLTTIERYAKDKLGMQKPDASQIKYLEIAKENKVELSENIIKEKNIFQNFFEEIVKILD